MPVAANEETHHEHRSDHHLYADRRSAAVGDPRLPADRPHLHHAGGRARRGERHLGRGADPGQFPRVPDAGAARARHACRIGPEDARTRRQHHQASEHQRVGAAACGGDQGTAGQGLQAPRLPRRPEDRRRKGHQGTLRQVHRLGREPGAARRQLRPPRAARGQGVRAKEPARDGRMGAGVAHARVAHAKRRLLPRREVDDAGPRARREDGADHQKRQDAGPEAQGRAAGRRDHRLDVHEQARRCASSTSARSRMRTSTA